MIITLELIVVVDAVATEVAKDDTEAEAEADSSEVEKDDASSKK